MTEQSPDDRAREEIPTVPTKSPDDLLNINDVARDFRIGREFIRQLVKSGELRHLSVGRKVLIPRWVMLEWVRDNLTSQPTHLDRPGAND